MNKLSSLLLSCIFLSVTSYSFAQKYISNAVLEYSVTTIDYSDASMNMTSHQKYYYAADQLRIDSWYDDGSTEIYFNGKNNTTTQTESGGGESYYNTYNASVWKQKSPNTIKSFTPTKEIKNIHGYKCKSAVVILNDNFKETIFYTSELIPSTEKLTSTKQNIPGFILEKIVYNTKGQITQKVSLKSFETITSPKSTFEPDIKGYTKHDIFSN